MADAGHPTPGPHEQLWLKRTFLRPKESQESRLVTKVLREEYFIVPSVEQAQAAQCDESTSSSTHVSHPGASPVPNGVNDAAQASLEDDLSQLGTIHSLQFQVRLTNAQMLMFRHNLDSMAKAYLDARKQREAASADSVQPFASQIDTDSPFH